MTDLLRIKSALLAWPDMRWDGARAYVPTQCLYPSNRIIAVYIEGGEATFKVHDDARTVDEAVSTTSMAFVSLGSARHIARRQGLLITDRWVIQSPLVNDSQLAGAVALVANVAKEVAHQMLDRARPKATRDIKEALAEILDRQFPHEWTGRDKFGGKSNKQHRFDFIVRLPHGRKLLIDAVAPEASAINSAVVAHMDVRLAEIPGIEQRIIYDDSLPWKSADLSLLSVGAKVVPLSRSIDVLQRIAA